MPNPYFVNILTPFSSPLTDNLTSSSLTNLLRKREQGVRLNDHQSQKIVLLQLLQQEEQRFNFKGSKKHEKHESIANQLKIVTELHKLCQSYFRKQAYTTNWKVHGRICEIRAQNTWSLNYRYVWEFEPNVKLSIGVYPPPFTQTASDRENARRHGELTTIFLDEMYRNMLSLKIMPILSIQNLQNAVLCENTPTNELEIQFYLKVYEHRKELERPIKPTEPCNY